MSSPGVAGTPRRRGIGRSVFVTQLVLAGSLLLVVLFRQAFAQEAPTALFFFGVTAVFALTGIAAVIPWERLPKWTIAVIPLADIAAIAMTRNGDPGLAASLFFVFPIIWMSTHFGLTGAVTSTALSIALLIVGTPEDWFALDILDAPRLVTAPVMLAFVAAVTYNTSKRSVAQRTLLRRQADLLEDALARAQRQQRVLDEVLNAVDFGVIGFDRSGRTTIMNQAHARLQMLGGREGEAVLLQADRRTPFPAEAVPLARAIRGEEFDNVVVWLDRAGEERRALSVSARQLENGRGESDGGVLVSRDVTAEINAVRARDDLVASVSHELRTPLTSILGYLELALDDKTVSDQTAGMLTIATKNAERLLALIADILAASSDRNNVLVLTFAVCDLAEIVQQSVESLTPFARDRSITISADRTDHIAITADGFRLRQVVDNLISNAVKYNVDGGEVSVGVASDDHNAWLIVRDTGLGIPDADQANLFDRFFRAESVRQSTIHGSGLGLSISRDIIRQHGGDLTLYSVEGEGTTVIATVPKAGPDATPTETEDDA